MQVFGLGVLRACSSGENLLLPGVRQIIVQRLCRDCAELVQSRAHERELRNPSVWRTCHFPTTRSSGDHGSKYRVEVSARGVRTGSQNHNHVFQERPPHFVAQLASSVSIFRHRATLQWTSLGWRVDRISFTSPPAFNTNHPLQRSGAGARSPANPHGPCDAAGTANGTKDTPARPQGEPWTRPRSGLRVTATFPNLRAPSEWPLSVRWSAVGPTSKLQPRCSDQRMS